MSSWGNLRPGSFVAIQVQTALGFGRQPAPTLRTLIEPAVHGCVVRGVLAPSRPQHQRRSVFALRFERALRHLRCHPLVPRVCRAGPWSAQAAIARCSAACAFAARPFCASAARVSTSIMNRSCGKARNSGNSESRPCAMTSTPTRAQTPSPGVTHSPGLNNRASCPADSIARVSAAPCARLSVTTATRTTRRSGSKRRHNLLTKAPTPCAANSCRRSPVRPWSVLAFIVCPFALRLSKSIRECARWVLHPIAPTHAVSPDAITKKLHPRNAQGRPEGRPVRDADCPSTTARCKRVDVVS